MLSILILNSMSTNSAANRIRTPSGVRRRVVVVATRKLDPVTEYIRARLKNVAAEGKSLRDIAAVAKVAPSFPTQVKNGDSGVGRAGPGFARAFGMSYPELTAAAYEWWETEGKARFRDEDPARWREMDERYPNRADAVGMARKLGYSEDAIKQVLALPLKSDEDPPTRKWLEKIQEVDRQMSDPFFVRPGRAPDEDV